MLDLIAIGDVTEDVFLQIDDVSTVVCDSQNHNCELHIPFGTKLGVSRVDKLLGGNAGNMAIGASRLGLKSALYAEVGEDVQGDLLYTSLKENKVSTKYFFRKRGEKTNYSVVLNHHAERTILVHHEMRAYRVPKFERVKWVYLTSMAKGSEKIFSKIISYVGKNKVKLAFNPGTYQLHLGLEKLRPLIEKCSVLIMNTEEAQGLLQTEKRDFKLLLSSLWKVMKQERGIVVITDGENGAYCYDSEEYYYCPIVQVPIVERTGSGDAFSTGFVCALRYGESVAEALRWGTVNSAAVIGEIGPQAGLLRLAKMKKVLNENEGFKARVLLEREVMDEKVYVMKKKGKI
ncbi:hypothetical protein A2642_03160 [Candidatus Nomurabacteria bacterium RIFCSPHIGHO2_01_FULL_39_10]|uniref:Carbohydrate kinase PfkB domain-containing protein n=1 Tax=Candidatus Nomurabacteria bacterium RIFCSPHIGHO2_01_FULL_39_10 TaxID=1801733 RepID=A0A1F6V600_9BACT|nr:MAG: hypothetical protein A2642_03160 [Candidatus Nomurabacteria bacterium RIFCSPHIGHO2_01_FULL_39_10]